MSYSAPDALAVVRTELDGLRADRLINDAALLCRLERFERETADLRKQLRQVTADRDAWKSQFEMWDRAWLRSLGGKLYPKAHRIDALVLTTTRMREQLEKFERQGIADRRAAEIAEYGPWVAKAS